MNYPKNAPEHQIMPEKLSTNSLLAVLKIAKIIYIVFSPSNMTVWIIYALEPDFVSKASCFKNKNVPILIDINCESSFVTKAVKPNKSKLHYVYTVLCSGFM